MIIGITGQIGSGKTAAAKLFRKHGFRVIDADKVSHSLMRKKSPIYSKLLKNFGKGILDENENIDRKKLGDLAFAEARKLKKLNSIMHAAIISSVKGAIKKNKNGKIIIDAPLLLETKAKNLVDKVIVVRAGIKKIFKRNEKFSKEQIERILNVQMPLNEKLKYADFVIDNNKGLKHMKKQVENAVNQLNNKFLKSK